MTPYLQIENLRKSFGGQVLFDDLKFGLMEGQRMALVAKNGAGKTTLLNIIAGKASPDQGTVTFKRDLAVGYLEQDQFFPPELTALEAVFYQSPHPAVQWVRQYEALLLHNRTPDSDLLEKMDHFKAWDLEHKAKQILTRLKIDRLDQTVDTLSGGQRKRVALARVLLMEPDLLLLDEPTNHLDLSMVEWLEDYLKRSRMSLLMVTHDRYFLDRICTDILEIDERQLYHYRGNFTYFLEKRQERIAAFNTEIERSNNLFRRELDWIRTTPSARTGKSKARVNAFDDIKAKAEARRSDGQIEIHVMASRLGKKIIEARNLCKAYDGIPYVDRFSYDFVRYEKLGILGENGSGKSTLLNLLTGNLAPDSGHVSKGETVVIGYYKQEGLRLDPNKKVIDVVREIAEYVKMGPGQNLTASQFLNHFLFPPSVQQNFVHKLSGGEKRRLYLLTILMKQPNFLILDEPTNDLDIITLSVLEDYLRSFEGCVLVVSHDRYFMDKVVDHLLVFQEGKAIKEFPGNYSRYREWLNAQSKTEALTGASNRRRSDSRTETSKQTDAAKATETLKKNVAAKATEASIASNASTPPKDLLHNAKPKRPKATYAQKRAFEALEEQLTLLNHRKEILENQLSSGTLAGDALMQASLEMGRVMQEIDDAEMRWLELSELEL